MFKEAILKTAHYILAEVIKGFKWKRNQQMQKSVVLEVMGETRITMLMIIFKLTKPLWALVLFSLVKRKPKREER